MVLFRKHSGTLAGNKLETLLLIEIICTSMSDVTPVTEQVEEATRNANYEIVDAEFGATARLKAEVDDSDVMFWFIYEHQGVWDTEERRYLSGDNSLEFDTENWIDDGENVMIPDETGRYHRSYILDRCETDDGTTVINY